MKGGALFPARLEYTKRGKVRFLGHRDVARNLERAFRITALPLSFSEGFNPHPKFSFGLALTVGYESDAEYLDVEFAEQIDLGALPEALTAALPDGISVTGAVWLDDRAPALQEAVVSVVWMAEVCRIDDERVDEVLLAEAIAKALASESIEFTKTRKGRSQIEDIRPLIKRLEIVHSTESNDLTNPCSGPIVMMELASKGAKPSEVLAAIGPYTSWRGIRTHQYIERDGLQCTPLQVDTRQRVAEAIAS